MNTPLPALPTAVLTLLWCARCRHRLCPESLTADVRMYQCSNGCRPKPVNGTWLAAQIIRALAWKVPPDRVTLTIDAITVTDQGSTGIKVLWKLRFPHGPQPPVTCAPATIFVPVRSAP